MYIHKDSKKSKPRVKRTKVGTFDRFNNLVSFIRIPKISGFGQRDKVRLGARVNKSNGVAKRKQFFRSEKNQSSSVEQTSVTDRIPVNQNHNSPFSKDSVSQSAGSSKAPMHSFRNKNAYSSTGEVKVFGPAKSDPVFSPVNSAKTSLYQTYFGNFFKEKKFQWGFKSIKDLKPSLKKPAGKSILYSINYFFKKYRVFERFNVFMLSTTLGLLVLFFLYLCFFDTFFLIKNYNITFAEASYLSPDDVEDVVTTIKEDKLLGFIPNNQYWYLSSRSLSIAAQNEYSEIDSIRVNRKVWPHSAELEIKTEPILITLGINQSEYWRIGYDGSVVSKDDGGLRQNLVIVERPVTFNRPDATLQDYSFAGDCAEDRSNEVQNCLQLNRFWFVVWMWNLLDQLKIDHTKTILPSLFDSDVIVELTSGSRLIFDSGTMSAKVQQDRMITVLGSIVGGQVNSGEIEYIDFRQPKKVYLCRVDQPCA